MPFCLESCNRGVASNGLSLCVKDDDDDAKYRCPGVKASDTMMAAMIEAKGNHDLIFHWIVQKGVFLRRLYPRKPIQAKFVFGLNTDNNFSERYQGFEPLSFVARQNYGR